MSENQGNQQSTADEIDLGQLFRLIGKAFDWGFRGILKIFLYFKRNLAWFAGLLIAGMAIGLLLRTVIVRKQRLDVIVTPNLNNKEYLSDAVAEVSSDIISLDTAFFDALRLDPEKIGNFEIELTPLRDERSKISTAEIDFLELLKDFGNADAAADVLRNELREMTTKDHRITFYFKDPKVGMEYSRRIIDYINSNGFYAELNRTYRENALKRIALNDSLIYQIDMLVTNYSERMKRELAGSEGRIVLENQETLDMPALLTLKNTLIRDTESKRLELVTQKDPITVISFGQPYQVQKSLFEKWLVLAPTILIGGFLLLSFIRFLDRKARQRNMQ